ncbi:MAG: hypothetical protein IBX71_03225 [Candidatus Desulforudis sp.]|nr:hypothetical protein [Desulforudis sp.]
MTGVDVGLDQRQKETQDPLMIATDSVFIISSEGSLWLLPLLVLGVLVLAGVLLWFWDRRHVWSRLVIAMVLLFVGNIAVVAYADHRLSDLREHFSGPVEAVVVGVQEQFPTLPPDRRQSELERRAGGVEGLFYLAVVSLEPDRGAIVAAHPFDLVGETVEKRGVPDVATGVRLRQQLFYQLVFPSHLDPAEYSLTSVGQELLEGDLIVLNPGDESTWVMWAQHVSGAELAPWERIYHGASLWIPVFFLAYWISVPAWVYQDARRRGAIAPLWGPFVLFTNLLGLAVYLFVRSLRR